MLSAFGVDHGDEEFSKIRMARMPMTRAQRHAKHLREVQRAKQIETNARRAAKIKDVATKGKAIPGKLVNADISIAGVGRGVGEGVRQVGTGVSRAVNKYPGTTGTAVVGGTGYGLYRSGRKKKE